MTDILKRLIEKYWVVYYIVYVVGVVVIVAMQWGKLQADVDPIFRLAAIFGVSAGIASFIAIVSEVFGRMVLLIPQAVKRLKKAGKDAEQARIQDILDQPDNGLSPEVVAKVRNQLFGPDSKE